MIKTWSVKNFKSVSKMTDLDFAPLTVFAGANSSGKSTILQSIILTTQTIQNSVHKKSVILNGNISKFGVFDDLISNNPDGDTIQIGFTLEPKLSDDPEDNYYYSRFDQIDDFKNLSCKFSFSGKSADEDSELLQLQPRLEGSYLQINYKEADSEEIEIVRSKKTLQERIKELKLNEKDNTRNFSSLEYELVKPTRLLQLPNYFYGRRPKNGKFAGAFMDHFLPGSISIVYDKIEDDKNQFIEVIMLESRLELGREVYGKYINEEIVTLLLELGQEVISESKNTPSLLTHLSRFQGFFTRLKNEFTLLNLRRLTRSPILGNEMLTKIDNKKQDIISLMKFVTDKDFQLEYIHAFNSWTEYIESFYKRKVKYLGPLRDEPKPVYPLLGTSDPKDVGLKGENTASVLDINSGVIIEYIPSSFFSDQIENIVPKKETLLNAVLDWLNYMGVANEVRTFDKGKFGHELKVLSPHSNSLHDLTHVGVGVSQLLPILVLALLSDTDSTMIFEQPELHLHPKVQTRLADFFVSMSFIKKQCIVETHSEYIINQLRYRVAISQTPTLAENIIIYFVEKEDDHSKYKKIKINKYGVIPDWPKGFFDESEAISSRILKAGMDKRAKEK